MESNVLGTNVRQTAIPHATEADLARDLEADYLLYYRDAEHSIEDMWLRLAAHHKARAERAESVLADYDLIFGEGFKESLAVVQGRPHDALQSQLAKYVGENAVLKDELAAERERLKETERDLTAYGNMNDGKYQGVKQLIERAEAAEAAKEAAEKRAAALENWIRELICEGVC